VSSPEAVIHGARGLADWKHEATKPRSTSEIRDRSASRVSSSVPLSARARRTSAVAAERRARVPYCTKRDLREVTCALRSGPRARVPDCTEPQRRKARQDQIVLLRGFAAPCRSICMRVPVASAVAAGRCARVQDCTEPCLREVTWALREGRRARVPDGTEPQCRGGRQAQIDLLRGSVPIVLGAPPSETVVTDLFDCRVADDPHRPREDASETVVTDLFDAAARHTIRTDLGKPGRPS
jgi:hypothetical protein